MQNLPNVHIQTDGGETKPAAVQRHFDPSFGGIEYHTFANLTATQETVFEQLTSEATWQRRVLKPISGGNHRISQFELPRFTAWKAARLVVSSNAANAKWRAHWLHGGHRIMCVDSDLVSLFADLSPNSMLRSEPEGESVLLFAPTLSARPGLLTEEIIRVETDSNFEQVPFALIVDVCDDPELFASEAWQKALSECHQEAIVRHTSETIVFRNDSGGATVPTPLRFAHIGNALLIRVERSPVPFDSCKLYLDNGNKKNLFLSVTRRDLVEIRPGWFVIPMGSIVSPAVVLSATRLQAFLDKRATLSASEHNISVVFEGQAANVTWEATFYWQHINLMQYYNQVACIYFT